MLVLTYLKLGNFKLGLLLNFHITTLKNGIKRILNRIHSTGKKDLTANLVFAFKN